MNSISSSDKEVDYSRLQKREWELGVQGTIPSLERQLENVSVITVDEMVAWSLDSWTLSLLLGIEEDY